MLYRILWWFEMRLSTLAKIYDRENVSVFGKKGSGKDLLTANIILFRNLPYVSNFDYGGQYIPFDYTKIDCGRNTFDNFITGHINFYDFPYPDKTDIYISDAGIYFPSQYCNELNKKYPYLPTYFALGRQLGLSSFHVNSQALNRVWDKIREQGDTYILCRRCFYLKGLVIQFITMYDRYDAAVSKMRPLRLPGQLFSNRESRMMRKVQIAQFEASHGVIQNKILIYRNKSTYNTREFKEILKKGSVAIEKT